MLHPITGFKIKQLFAAMQNSSIAPDFIFPDWKLFWEADLSIHSVSW